MTTVKRIQLALVIPFFLQTATTALGQYAWFARNTDIIAVSGQTELNNECTIEAVILLPSDSHSGGSIFDEWALNQEEKYLTVSVNSIGAIAYPNDYLDVTEKAGLLTLDTWHHVAFVCNGTEQRIYLDGLRIQSGPATSPIGNGPAPAFLGYAPRNGSDFPSFVGFLDSLRVSNVARYSGLSFKPPMGDMTSDTNTVLLYNFNDPTNSTTVTDESPLGRTGTLGIGFPGATAPKLVSKLRTSVPIDLRIYTAVELQFPTSSNVLYTIQSSPDMAVWSDFSSVTGDGSTTHQLFSTQGLGRLFYRVIISP